MPGKDDFHQMLQIGKSVPRLDARGKVTGQEVYASDRYEAGMLWAGVKRAGIPHARIRQIRTDDAKKLPGVVAVLTHENVAGSNRQGVVRKDQPVLVDDRIRHCGEAVALIVAQDRSVLQSAADQIRVDVEPLPAMCNVKESLQENAPKVHEDNPDGNILLKGRLEIGEGMAAFKVCDAVVTLALDLPWQEHAYLETECGTAIFRESGELEIVASTQTPFRDRMEVADALGLDSKKVRIIAPYCGGAFGGKDGITVQSLLGLAALHCPGRMIKMVWEREESFLASSKRHPANLRYRLGAKADGTFHALDARIYYDTGAYDHLGGVVMTLGLEHAGGPYRIPNARLSAWSVYTNNPVGGAFRGFGVPQVAAAMEQAVDMMAVRLNMTPLDIRLRNSVRKGDKNPAGMTLTTSTGMIECLEKLAESPLWIDRHLWKAAAGSFKRRGVGMAAVMHGMGYGTVVPDVANAKIELTPEGRFCVYCGVVDMGQGNASTYLQIAGDLLNQDTGCLDMVLPDTARTLPSGSSSASRTTYTFGNALAQAVEILKQRILQRAADLLMADGMEQMTLIPGMVMHLPTGKTIPLSDIPRFMNETERFATARFRSPVCKEGMNLSSDLRLHGIPHLIFSYSVHLAAVEVDQLTGAVEVCDYLAISDCGRILNPQLFTQQIHGGIAQGIGYALYEDFQVKNGQIRTRNFTTYILPTAMDLPAIHVAAVELQEHTGPFGMKGAGEIAIDAVLPAIANAISDGCSIRLARFPMTAERLLRSFPAQ